MPKINTNQSISLKAFKHIAFSVLQSEDIRISIMQPIKTS